MKRSQQEHRDPTAKLLLSFIFCMQSISGASASDVSAYSVVNQQAFFRYTTSAAGTVPESLGKMTCVASELSGGWIVTAAHCLKRNDTQLSFYCMESSGQLRVETVQIDKVVQHDTHDVALLKLKASSCDNRKTVEVATIVPPVASFEAPVFNSSLQSGWQLEYAKLNEVRRDEYTLRLSDESACLLKGDSGSPILTQDKNTTPEIAAILIAGSLNCPSIQTAVRLDRLLPWVHRTIH